MKKSATKRLPLASTSTPRGLLKEAAAPTPSRYAANPLPASVLTKPPGVIFLIQLLPASATKMLPLAPTATPRGLSKEATAPVPSANAADPLPASVLTTPPDVILRMRLLAWSATKILLLASMSTLLGRENEAPAPVPSANAADPLPAKVVTTPPGVTLRTRWLSLSATKALLDASMVKPQGPLNEAVAPVPSKNVAVPLPASKVTEPAGEILRIRLLPSSATNTLLTASVATSNGPINEALAPTPLAYVAVPLPANELTVPPGVILRTRLLAVSATNTLFNVSTATPRGELKEAPVPTPLAYAAVPLPANVVTTTCAPPRASAAAASSARSAAAPRCCHPPAAASLPRAPFPARARPGSAGRRR